MPRFFPIPHRHPSSPWQGGPHRPTNPPVALPPWPELPPWVERVQSLLGGDITLRRRAPQDLWQAGFCGNFELMLRHNGTRVGRRAKGQVAAVMLWAHGRLPALFAALGQDLDVMAHELTQPSPDGAVVGVLDVWDRRKGALLDHAALRDVCTRARLEPPTVALLGEVRTLADLQARMAALGAPGTVLEARREEGGVVTARALVTVEAGRSGKRG